MIPQEVTEMLMEKLRDKSRQQVGLDEKSPEEIYQIAHQIIDLLPVDRMKVYAADQSRTGSVTGRLRAKQIGILLFAREEMVNALLGLSRDELKAACMEILARR